MASRPIKLNLDGEEVHLVPARELARWNGYPHARRAAWELMTPENVQAIRDALFVPPTMRTEEVFEELRKQLEDGSALFFELPPAPVPFETPRSTDLIDLLPDGSADETRPDLGPTGGLHWIEVVCLGADGGGYPGAHARVRLPDGRREYVTLDGRSSVRFDDLTEGGTVHFELSADALPSGSPQLEPGSDYVLGSAIGLTTHKRHVLRVQPNPDAFVSVLLTYENEPVVGGRYTLHTKRTEDAGALEGGVVRADNLVLPSTATFSFEAVIPPPRVDEHDPKNNQSPSTPGPTGTDPATHQPGNPPPPLAPSLPPDGLSIAFTLPDGTPVPVKMQVSGSVNERLAGDAMTFEDVRAPVHIRVSAVELPSESPA